MSNDTVESKSNAPITQTQGSMSLPSSTSDPLVMMFRRSSQLAAHVSSNARSARRYSSASLVLTFSGGSFYTYSSIRMLKQGSREERGAYVEYVP